MQHEPEITLSFDEARGCCRRADSCKETVCRHQAAFHIANLKSESRSIDPVREVEFPSKAKEEEMKEKEEEEEE